MDVRAFHSACQRVAALSYGKCVGEIASGEYLVVLLREEGGKEHSSLSGTYPSRGVPAAWGGTLFCLAGTLRSGPHIGALNLHIQRESSDV